MARLVLLCALLIVLGGCFKKYEACVDEASRQTGFLLSELVKDSFIVADTTYANTEILFKANDNYAGISWTIGTDPRVFSSQEFQLRFLSAENLNITLSGQRLNRSCTYEPFTFTKSLVLLPDDGTIKSALTGDYPGHNTDSPRDTFTVSIKRWISPTYTWWPTGAYSIDNLPRGYRDTTQSYNGVITPEITGIVATTKYKNMAFDRSGNILAAGIKGYAMLKRGFADTLVVNYTLLDTALLNNSGQVAYFKKTFIGIKK